MLCLHKVTDKDAVRLASTAEIRFSQELWLEIGVISGQRALAGQKKMRGAPASGQQARRTLVQRVHLDP